MEHDKYNVLMVCTGNTCRSPFAEVALKSYFKSNFPSINIEVSSAGIMAHDGQPASNLAKYAANSFALDLSKHKSQLLTKEMLETNDFIFVMTKSHFDFLKNSLNNNKLIAKVFIVSNWLDGKDIDDPYYGDGNTYLKVFNRLFNCIPSVANYILTGK